MYSEVFAAIPLILMVFTVYISATVALVFLKLVWPVLVQLLLAASSAVSLPTHQTKQEGHQKYIDNHYAACPALFYKFANYRLCHSSFPPGSPSSSLHQSQREKK